MSSTTDQATVVSTINAASSSSAATPAPAAAAPTVVTTAAAAVTLSVDGSQTIGGGVGQFGDSEHTSATGNDTATHSAHADGGASASSDEKKKALAKKPVQCKG